MVRLNFQIEKLLGHATNVGDIMKSGPSFCIKLSKGLKSHFWSQVFSSAALIIDCFVFKHPEKLVNSSFWYNPMLKKSNKVLVPSNFPKLNGVISYLGDFFTLPVLTL